MSRIKDLARSYWFDGLIAVLAVVAMLELIIGRDSPASARTLWFALPAVAVSVTPIFARRRFPFAGPAAYWFLAAGISVVDWRPIPFAVSLFPVGLTVAFLLGNLRNALKAALGLAIVVGASAIVVYVIPDHSTAELVFIPIEFVIAWVGGFAVRERSEQVAAAEIRTLMAERERDAAARVAVAEERPLGQRDGAPGRGGEAQAPRRARRGSRGVEGGRAGGTVSPCRDAPSARRHA